MTDDEIAVASGSFAPPPAEKRLALTEMIRNATSGLAPGDRAVVGQVTTEGFHGAFVLKTKDDSLDLMLWIGKEGGWDSPGIGAGFAVAKKWKG